MRLKDKTVIITGGGGEVGLASAFQFLKEGARVVLLDISDNALDAAASSLQEYQERVRTLKADVRSLAEMAEAARFTVEAFGGIDILLTCAGIARHKPITQMSFESWKEVLDVNMDGVFTACKAVTPHMQRQHYGRIVHISSICGRTGRPNVGVDYAASKAGVIGLTMMLSYELGPDNITVNAIAPAALKGHFNDAMPPEKVAKLVEGSRLGRMGNPVEVAYAAVYLASDEAAWITGEVLDMNGGLYY